MKHFVRNLVRQMLIIGVTAPASFPLIRSANAQDTSAVSANSATDGSSLLTVSGDGTVRRTKLQAAPEIFREVTWLLGKAACAAIPGANQIVTPGPLSGAAECRVRELMQRIPDNPVFVESELAKVYQRIRDSFSRLVEAIGDHPAGWHEQ